MNKKRQKLVRMCDPIHPPSRSPSPSLSLSCALSLSLSHLSLLATAAASLQQPAPPSSPLPATPSPCRPYSCSLSLSSLFRAAIAGRVSPQCLGYSIRPPKDRRALDPAVLKLGATGSAVEQRRRPRPRPPASSGGGDGLILRRAEAPSPLSLMASWQVRFEGDHGLQGDR